MSVPGQDRLYNIHEWPQTSELKDAFVKFRKLKQELKGNGHFDAETPYNRFKLPPYLYTWFQTREAMVMLLSNQTFQVK